MSTSRRRAVVRIDSPAIEAINRDNTIASEADPAAAHPQDRSAPGLSAMPSSRGDVPQSPAGPAERQGEASSSSGAVAPMAAPALSRKKTVSFRTGLTSRAVIDTAMDLATSHNGDPDLVLRRLVRDALGTLHARIAAWEFKGFRPVSVRPQSLLALDTSTRIAPDDLDRLAAHIDPMQVFRQSAVIGFAVDQIVTDLHGH